jgi:hypothetical protein
MLLNTTTVEGKLERSTKLANPRSSKCEKMLSCWSVMMVRIHWQAQCGLAQVSKLATSPGGLRVCYDCLEVRPAQEFRRRLRHAKNRLMQSNANIFSSNCVEISQRRKRWRSFLDYCWSCVDGGEQCAVRGLCVSGLWKEIAKVWGCTRAGCPAHVGRHAAW